MQARDKHIHANKHTLRAIDPDLIHMSAHDHFITELETVTSEFVAVGGDSKFSLHRNITKQLLFPLSPIPTGKLM